MCALHLLDWYHYLLRYAAVAICGILCGIAGAYLATGLSAGFVKEMTAGRGFIALAALIFAKWRPWQALFATFLFGLLEAIANLYPNLDLGFITIPSINSLMLGHSFQVSVYSLWPLASFSYPQNGS